MTNPRRLLVHLTVAAWLAGCNGNGTFTNDAGVDGTNAPDAISDMAVHDAPLHDAPVQDGNMADANPGDTGRGDTGNADATPPIDATPGGDPCAAGAVINLNTAGTLSGPTTTYMGSNTLAEQTPPETAPCGDASFPVAYSYTTRTSSQLIVSTFHAATLANLDTLVWVQMSCDAGDASTLALCCDDDVPSTDQARPMAVPATAQKESICSTQPGGTGVNLPAGTTVYIFVGGSTFADNTDTFNQGTYQLTVTEVALPSAMGAPCEPASALAQCAANLSCAATGSDDSSFSCEDPGTAFAACTPVGNACVSGLTCDMNLTPPVCVPTVAVGGDCDVNVSTNMCTTGATCVVNSTGNGTCIANGSAGGVCQITLPACDSGLSCSPVDLCVPAVNVGASCDPTGATNACVTGSSCQPAGSASLCVQDGTLGGVCLFVTPQCATGLTCNGATNTCAMMVGAGAPCDSTGVTTICDSGSTCLTVGTSTTCVADGSLGGICSVFNTPPCNAGLVCSIPSAPGARCVTQLTSGQACEPFAQTTLCPTGSACAGATGNATCATHGYAASPSTATWIDACAATGSVSLLSGTDYTAASIPLPFAVTFYGFDYAAGSSTTVTPDGWYSFTPHAQPVVDMTTFPVPAPDNAIYALYEDLNFASPTGTGTTGSVCYATTGTVGSRTLTIEWFNAYYNQQSASDQATFEVQLHEGTGAYDVIYNVVQGTEAQAVAAVGNESAGGSSFLQVCAGDTAPQACTGSSFANTRYTPAP